MRMLAIFLLLCPFAFAGGAQRAITFSSVDDVLPHFVFSGSWNTSVTFVNFGHDPVEFPLEFFRDDGTPMMVPIADVGLFSRLDVGIAAHGSVTFETDGDPNVPTEQGWVKVDLSCCNNVTGLAVFRQRIGDRESEAVVPLASSLSTQSGMIFDNTAGFITGVAMVNTSAVSVATITIAFRQEDGARIHLDQFTLDPREHRAFALPNEYPETRESKGTMEFLAHGGGLALLGLRFSPRGSFTSFHSFDQTLP